MNIIKYLIGVLNRLWNCIKENEELKAFIKQTQNFPLDFQFKSKSYITFSNIYHLCFQYTNDIRIADIQYRTLYLEEWQRLLNKLWVKPFRWQKEVFDCDDFAIFMLNRVMLFSKLKGLKYQLGFGIAWSDRHAFNCFILWSKERKTYELLLYEPQTNQFIRPNFNETYRVRKIMFLT